MMVRSPCCSENDVKKGPWTPEEDEKLVDYMQKHGGHGSWRALPKQAGLNRCGKSCRLRWTNYLRPDIKRGNFSEEEEQIIIKLHSVLGNKWSAIATHLPGRTDNEVKNFWNTHLKKKLLLMGIDPATHKPRPDLNLFRILPQLLAASNFMSPANTWDNALRLQAEVAQLARLQLLQNLVQVITGNAPPNLESYNYLMKSDSFQNYQSIESLPSRQFGGLDDHLGLSNGPIQTLSDYSNSGNPSCDHQAFAESCVCFEGQETGAGINGYSLKVRGNDNDNVSYTVANTNPTSAVVLDSLEQEQISTHSPTSTTFEAWGELHLDDQTSDYCWGDFVDQTSPHRPITSKNCLL